VFSFEGLVLASVIFNLPFAIQPAQRGFEAIPVEVREAAACCGMSPLAALWKVELPLAWPGLMTAMVLTFAHTLGEFGIVLMVGGSIPGETKTIAIAIYDRVQAFDDRSAAIMSAVLVAISLFTIASDLLRCRPASGGGCPDGARGDGAGTRRSRSTWPSGWSRASSGAGRAFGVGQDDAPAHHRRALAARVARVRVDGETWLDTAAGVDLPPHRRRVGIVFQNYALFPHMTAART
jgi:hypothetical protein